MLENGGRNPGAGVAHAQDYVLTGPNDANRSHALRHELLHFELDSKHAAVRHGSRRVVGEIHHHLVHLGGIAEHRGTARPQA